MGFITIVRLLLIPYDQKKSMGNIVVNGFRKYQVGVKASGGELGRKP
jgi:hypothetical protein